MKEFNNNISNFNQFKFNNLDELISDIENYFLECDSNDIPYTITGLSLALNTTRKTLMEWDKKVFSNLTENDNKMLGNVIRKAKTRVENYNEIQLYKNKNTAGVIFSLKNNYGWRDQQEITQTVKTDTELLEGLSEEDLRKLVNGDFKQLEE